MRHIKQAMRSGLRIALFLSLARCNALEKTKVLGLEQSASFSAAALAQDGAVIGAVASSEPERLTRESSAEGLASALRVAFLENRPQMKVLPPASVELALGAEKHRALVSFFEKTGDLQGEHLPEIHQNLHDTVRYLLVARIESDEISTSENDDERWEHDAYTERATWVNYGTKYTTSRTTTMLFAIYDLQTASREWKGHFKTSNDHVRTVASPEEGNLLEFLLEVLSEDGDDSASKFPAPVSIQEQTHRIYDEFLDTLFASEDKN